MATDWVPLERVMPKEPEVVSPILPVYDSATNVVKEMPQAFCDSCKRPFMSEADRLAGCKCNEPADPPRWLTAESNEEMIAFKVSEWFVTTGTVPNPECRKCSGLGRIETTTEANKAWLTFKPCDCRVQRVILTKRK